MDGFDFKKSSYSGGEPHAECLEIALNVPHTVAVRDSKHPDGPILRLAPAAWGDSAAAVRYG